MAKSIYAPVLAILIFTSCVIQTEDVYPDQSVENGFFFPESFEFKDSKEVQVTITGASGGMADVYLNAEQPVHLGKFAVGDYSHRFLIPDIQEEVLIVYDNGQVEESVVFDVRDEYRMVWDLSGLTHRSSRLSNSCTDRLYVVENSFGGFWEIDITNEDYNETQLANLSGGGSIACALDQENGLVYYNVGRTLYAYDVHTGTFSTVHSGNPFNGNYPRLAFKDGLFYMSNTNKLYVVDAASNTVQSEYTISGYINSNGGGDVDFASDGTLYLSCFSGLYKFTSFAGSTATIERISAENFPYKLTSMAIDRQDRIFVGTNDSNSKLLEMNKEDGSFRIVRTYDHKINDLTAWRCADEDLSQVDSDKDGIIDELDDHPNDPEVAFDVFTPSEIGYGTLAFEDMWPYSGDYDFNDLVLNYRFTNVMNANNEAVRLEIELKLLAAGATYENGFGIELPVNKSLIQSVEGAQLTESLISTDEKGLEAGQSNAVIIPFDNTLALFNAGSMINTRPNDGFIDPVLINMTVRFTEPIEFALLADAPYNPFIFVNGDRSREVHLKDELPTDLADQSLFETIEDFSDLSEGKSYINEDNVPWAINMIHNFRFPVEKTRIDGAYNYFVSWGRSNGANHKDWYKDNSGNRNTSKIVFLPE